ncbi:MAG: hypothetical protein A2008_11765 [Candidatus Wallbacteria bacterium GWC2_49_35]|uniref:Metallo-beta-lactamase domain-containing protein n=1 Tax=Candidatus Wallbacteria bacterium GWC2_49_35 TaxID=1817813 RepID=A0A1F7WGI5_9BACT|nr:MAG: hypothetical protein A2008_11765 [Candidatus Wallbacteria bacterium GWC2_49_35]HBC75154.1 hypothetical protein [Candidatus Wallbacteria bacterium]
MIFKGYSKAKYSNWLYYSPYHTLFDAGEGINTILEEKIVAINNIILSHGHTDHYTGLINILMTKFGHYYSTGEFNDLAIYYPKDDAALIAYIKYIREFYNLGDNRKEFKIKWVEVEADRRYEFNTKLDTYLETFGVEHTKDVISIGYNVMERRRKLRPEFASVPPESVKKLIDEKGRDNVIYLENKRTITYCGDSVNAPVDKFMDTDILIHEATFLKTDDRFGQLHSTLEEAFDTAVRAKTRRLILMHISTRYKYDEIKTEIGKMVEKYSTAGIIKVDFIVPGKIFEV